ncbi:hypothetical protein RAS1_10770 [Phycisphaerae bacterium RAS1]|nr:hypothetical protein RAS1_10770 [Phycisphaerae bacterium RAS1]
MRSWLGVLSRVSLLTAALALGVMSGCVSVKAPERIDVGREPPPPVDSSRLPATATHDECRYELEKAYQNIQYLEGENSRLERKSQEYKRERDDYKKRLKRYEDD